MVIFAFDALGVHRLDPRVAVHTPRYGANGRIGAAREAALRSPFWWNGHDYDQSRWSTRDADRRQAKAVWGPKVH